MYGYEDEVRAGGKRLFRIAREHGARYLGDEISEGDWAARHDRYATPLHGRTKDGQVMPMSWHCEDAAINYTQLPAVSQGLARDRRRPAPPDRRVRRLGHVRLHPRAAPAATTSPRSTSASGSSSWTTRAWALWVNAKRDIAAVAIDAGGSISACHGSCREGEVDLVPARARAAAST